MVCATRDAPVVVICVLIIPMQSKLLPSPMVRNRQQFKCWGGNKELQSLAPGLHFAH